MTPGLVFASIVGQLNHASVTTVIGTRVYRDRAPASATFPYAIVSAQPQAVSDTLPGEAYVEGMYDVKVVDKAQTGTTADTGYLAVHARLQNAELTITGYTTMLCRRSAFFSYDEDIEGGERAQHVGGTYRIMATPT